MMVAVKRRREGWGWWCRKVKQTQAGPRQCCRLDPSSYRKIDFQSVSKPNQLSTACMQKRLPRF